MSYGLPRGVQQYQKVGASGAAYADPHSLVQMLMDGAIDRLAQARGAIQRGDTLEKVNLINKAARIIEGLQASLDAEKGGELAANLQNLYEYMQLRLLHANARNDADALSEVGTLLREIREAWMAMPIELRQSPAANGTTG